MYAIDFIQRVWTKAENAIRAPLPIHPRGLQCFEDPGLHVPSGYPMNYKLTSPRDG